MDISTAAVAAGKADNPAGLNCLRGAPRGMLARPDILSAYKFGNARGRALLAGG